jgi:hypothetical protein
MKMAVFWVAAPVVWWKFIKLIALMMEAASTSETSVNFYRTTQRYKPEDIFLLIVFQQSDSWIHRRNPDRKESMDRRANEISPKN